jgi:subtilisin-like proprotein convertase family protein
MKLRATLACVAAGIASLSLAAAASAATQTKSAAGPGLNIRATSVATTTFVSEGLRGKLIDVNVAINGISHTFPEDIEATLTGPNGASVALMSDAGDGTDVAGINLLFDDSAAAKLPLDPPGPGGAPLLGGTYQPTNHVGTQAPPDPDLTATVPTLAGLTGANPNGTWFLRITDDFGLEDETGSYAGSVLTITTSFKKKCKKKKGKKGAVAAKKCGKKKKGKASISVR